MNVKRINKFIEGRLVKKIRKNADAYRILNERDLESLVYHELRKKLDKYEDVKISTNFTVTGTSWKRKSGGAGKFIQPDIVILESRDKRPEHKPKMHVAIELKARTPGKSIYQDIDSYRTLFSSRTLQKDFKKLNKLKEDIPIGTGYFLYLFHDTDNKESKVEKILNEEFPNTRDWKRGVRRKFKIIMINKFEKYVKGGSYHKAEIFKHRSRQLYRYYADEKDTRRLWDPCPECGEVLPHESLEQKTKCEKKEDEKYKTSTKSGWTKAKHSAAAKKAARTRKRNAAAKKAKRAAAARRRRKRVAAKKRNS